MSCRWVRHQLSPYLDSMLEERAATRVKRHLEVCASCAWELRTLQRGAGLIRGLERHAPPADSWQSILARIPDRLTQQNRRAWLRPALAGAFVTGLIAVILFAALPRHNLRSKHATGGGGANACARGQDRRSAEAHVVPRPLPS